MAPHPYPSHPTIAPMVNLILECSTAATDMLEAHRPSQPLLTVPELPGDPALEPAHTPTSISIAASCTTLIETLLPLSEDLPRLARARNLPALCTRLQRLLATFAAAHPNPSPNSDKPTPERPRDDIALAKRLAEHAAGLGLFRLEVGPAVKRP